MYIKTDRVPNSNPNPWGVPNLLSSPEYSSPPIVNFPVFFHLGHLYSNPIIPTPLLLIIITVSYPPIPTPPIIRDSRVTVSHEEVCQFITILW